jgi:hypothetical protein
MAAKWMMALVEPPIAWSTTMALCIASAVMMLSGVRPERARPTASLPVASA